MADGPKAAPLTELLRRHNGLENIAELELVDGDYNGAILPRAQLGSADLTRSRWQDADLSWACLTQAKLRRATFTKARLSHADLRGADLRGTNFTGADLRGADMRGCEMDRDTLLRNAQVDGLAIDRHSLRQLGPDHGELSEAARAELRLHDDAITLALHFGGWKARLHLAAVLVFLLPHADFLVRTAIATRLEGCAETSGCLPLAVALWQQVRTGGRGESTDVAGLAIFALLLVLNAIRLALMWRAQQHRAEEQASGLPRRLRLAGPWAWALKAWQVLIVLNIVLIGWHLMFWLGAPVRPIP
jgi:hypothetical protein